MTEPIISRMRERVGRLRRMATMAHDRKMIEMLLRTASEIEADADRLQASIDAASTREQ
jgi:hypothetical protein